MRELGFVVAWLAIALGLRFLRLDAKPIWADEWTTFVFSLGHSFRTLPVNQLLSLDELLQPVTLDRASPGAGIRALMNESTHPPLYFWLSHFWIGLWQQPGALISAGVGRSLSALLGAATVPLSYLIARWLQFPRRTARLAMALMAVSPFGLYLAQDARHYTLALVWCLISLGCIVKAWQAIQLDQPLSKSLVAGWILSNGLGFASHYFYGLFLAAQGLAFAGLALGRGGWVSRQIPSDPEKSQDHQLPSVQKILPIQQTSAWWGVAIAALGSGLAVLPWGLFLRRSAQSNLTSWLEQDLSGLALLDPLGRLFTWFLSMVMLLPIEQVPLGVAIASGLLLLGSLVWIVPSLWRSWRELWRAKPFTAEQSWRSQIPLNRTHLQALGALLVSELLLFFVIIYGFGRDISLSPRYVFSLLPVVSFILALLLSHQWPRDRSRVRLALVLGCLGSLTIATGFAYQKPDRPDLWVQTVRQYYQASLEQTGEAWPGDPLSPELPRSLVITTIQKTHSDTAKLMGIAQEWQTQDTKELQEPQILLLKRNAYTRSATAGLRAAIANLPRPFDLWIVNFSAHINFRDLGCSRERVARVRSPGYSAHRYVCNSHSI